MGISRSVTSKQSLHISKTATRLYAPPELIRKHPFDFKVDKRALGYVLYYLASEEHPFDIKRQQNPKSQLVRDNISRNLFSTAVRSRLLTLAPLNCKLLFKDFLVLPHIQAILL